MLADLKNYFRPGKIRKNLFAEMLPAVEYWPKNQQPIFITGPGRSGTHFMAKLFEALPGMAAYHLDDVGDSVGDSFELYRQWHRFNISNSGFLNSRGFLIAQAQQKQARFVESNPLIAFSWHDLLARFGGSVVIMVRHPRHVVESHFRKGWYKQGSPQFQLHYGYEYFHDRPNHFFSRIKPLEPSEYDLWKHYTRLGQIAWMWQATYQRIFDQMQRLAHGHVVFVQLEQLHWSALSNLTNQLQIQTGMNEQQFKAIQNARPGKGNEATVLWSDEAQREFNSAVRQVLPLMPTHIDTSAWLFP